jgi:hypothetical protein
MGVYRQDEKKNRLTFFKMTLIWMEKTKKEDERRYCRSIDRPTRDDAKL